MQNLGLGRNFTIYISDEMMEIWKDIEISARDEKRGIGYYICKNWKFNKIA